MSESKTLPYVLAFADLMEEKLSKNRDKGDREGWLKTAPQALFARLIEEVGEAAAYMAMQNPDTEALISELADISNFCMMLADCVQHSDGEKQFTQQFPKKDETLEDAIRWAHKLKKKALELYPDKRFRVAVDSLTQAIEFACISEKDTFWNTLVTNQVLDAVNKALKPELDDQIRAKIIIQ